MPQIETMNPESMRQIGALHEDDNIIPQEKRIDQYNANRSNAPTYLRLERDS
jgi:hypothetical protein